MADNYKNDDSNNFEKTMKEYLKQARKRLDNEFAGTREAIKLVATDKMRNFMQTMDKGLSKEERDFLISLITEGMYQSFCYGYGVGKIEGTYRKKVYL